MSAWGGDENSCNDDRCEFPREPKQPAQKRGVFQVRRTKRLYRMCILTIAPLVVDHEAYTSYFALPWEIWYSIRGMHEETHRFNGKVWYLSRHPGFYEANNRAIPDLTLERNLRYQEIRTLSSQSLLSRDWTLASRIFGSSGQSVRSLNLTRTPALFPLLRLNFWHRGRAAQAKGCLKTTGCVEEFKVRFVVSNCRTNFQKCLSVVKNKQTTSRARNIQIMYKTNKKLPVWLGAHYTAVILCAIIAKPVLGKQMAFQ